MKADTKADCWDAMWIAIRVWLISVGAVVVLLALAGCGEQRNDQFLQTCYQHERDGIQLSVDCRRALAGEAVDPAARYR